jgi:hypothetical protein
MFEAVLGCLPLHPHLQIVCRLEFQSRLGFESPAVKGEQHVGG